MSEVSRKRTRDSDAEVVAKLKVELRELSSLITKSRETLDELSSKRRDVLIELDALELKEIERFVVDNHITIAKENLHDLPDDVKKHTIIVDIRWAAGLRRAGLASTVMLDEFDINEIIIDSEVEEKLPNIRREVEDFISDENYAKSFTESYVQDTCKYHVYPPFSPVWIGSEKLYVYVGRGKETKKQRPRIAPQNDDNDV